MASGRKRKKNQSVQVTNLNNLEQINFNAAGLDIGAAEIWACVPADRDEHSVRCFETFTVDLHALADWLEGCGVQTVAMESTGVYWIPIYEILEARGLDVNLINAQHIKNVPGKKTDVLDCQWIQKLHTYGLLQASFRPDEQMSALRAYLRHRANLIRYRSAHIQQMQKALHQMNIQLTNVISDITGQTGLQIIRAIVAGKHDPVKLAQYRHPGCRSSEDKIAKSLEGHYKSEHLFALQQALEGYDFYGHQINVCDLELEHKYKAFRPQVDIQAQPLPPARRKPRRQATHPNYDLRTYLYQMSGVDLTQIDGIDALTAQTIIAEVGLDMSKWPTVKHFTSWLGLAPHNHISGGKVLKRKTKKTNNRANTALRIAALGAGRSQSALGGFYRRMRAKHGSPKAITATAHKIARTVYHMLKYRDQFIDPGQDYYEQKYRERIIKNLQRKAKELDMQLVPTEA